ncbi:hypothetical protein [Desulfospira joergensenii]|uniref:hypothetical protein n=1 Tax=Desulfospira joergensenii TaxID=53329 RepID=UPI0003B59F35|nr:hypothetical protein [Desulfospira joergensenii]
MKLSIPYISSPDYSDYLQTKLPFLESIYFSLGSGPVLDSRIRISSLDIQTLARELSPFSRTKKYCLLNTRFVRPGLYMDKGFLTQALDKIEILHETCGLDGIVFTDFYLLKGLDRTGHPIVPRLEALPGVNCMIDTSQKAFAFMEMIETTRFKLPGKIILDRSLNREPKKLASTVRDIKAARPHIKIELLANEGCIYQCPFKLGHDAQISLSNTGLVRETTYRLNQELGCHAYFHDHGHRFLKSPFIRPEDLPHYSDLADSVKLCGRTLGRRFLIRCIEAYIDRSFDGNLLDLMDAANFLSGFYHMDNKKLDPDFFKTLTSCTKDCKCCNLCTELFSGATVKNKPILQPYEDYR